MVPRTTSGMVTSIKIANSVTLLQVTELCVCVCTFVRQQGAFLIFIYAENGKELRHGETKSCHGIQSRNFVIAF